MSARELTRRVMLWGIVALAFVAFVALAILGEWTALLGFSAFPIVGAIILTSRPGNGVGWYLLGVGIVCLAIMWGLDPEISLLAPAWAESAMNAIAGAFWSSLIVIAAIYPTGRAETRLGRIGLWGIAVLAATMFVASLIDPAPMFNTGRPNPFAVPGVTFPGALVAYVYPLAMIAAIVVILVDLVLRWRGASPIARLQYRWFVSSVVAVVVVIGVSALIVTVAPGSVADVMIKYVATVSLNLIPISIGIAVTRHGLYEINRVVSRTVSYTAVTVLVIGVYALVVTSSTILLPQLPSVGVAVATLAAAALFLPLLRRVQRAIDRRFDRERYVSEHIVDAFGEQLRTRIDPSATADDLLRTVDKVLQPASAGLWRREPQR